MKAKDVKVGDILDLEGDRYADPSYDREPAYEYSFVEVKSVARESGRVGIVVYSFELGDDVEIGFPPDHELYDPTVASSNARVG